MGSRISRAIYKNERNKPIKTDQQQSIKQLITYFVAGIISLFFFLFGYIFRPHLNNHNSLGIFLIIILLFTVLKLKQINRVTILSSLLLLFITIISNLIGINMMFLKSILILTTIILTSVIGFEIGSNSFIKSLFIWLYYECFNMGIMLSLHVQKIHVESNNGEVRKEESILAQLIFSIIGTMIVVLAIYGSKVLKVKAQAVNKHMNLTQKYSMGLFNMIILVFTLSIKRQIQHEFLVKLYNILISLIIIILLNRQNLLKYAWIMVLSLSIVITILQITTQYQPELMIYLNKAKSVVFNIMIVDTLTRWLNYISYGNHRPFIIILGYFIATYIAQLSYGGIYIYEQLEQHLLFLISLISYGGSILQSRSYKVEQYQQVI